MVFGFGKKNKVKDEEKKMKQSSSREKIVDGDSNNSNSSGNGITKAKVKKPFVQRLKKQLKNNLLLILTVISVLFGIGLGFLLRATTNLSPPVRHYFGFPGELFLRGLKFIILPLISSSLVTGIAGLGVAKTGRVAIRALLLYFTTTFSAVIIGLVLVSTIKPGNLDRDPVTKDAGEIDSAKLSTVDTFMDLLRNLIPENMVEMTFQLYASSPVAVYKFVNKTLNSTANATMGNSSLGIVTNLSNETVVQEKVVDYYMATQNSRRGLDVLGLVVFCITFGAVLASMGERAKIMIEFFEILNEASIKIIRLMMWFSPVGIASLITVAVLEMDDPVKTFKSISFYMMTVLVGLAIQGFILLPTLYLVLTRKNVLIFGKNMIEALMVALATASSAATLPITFKCIEQKNKIPKVISRFVLPVGATVNLDGTALYEAVASIFIAQMSDIKLSFIDLVVTSITATLASIGAAGIPSAGLVTMIIVLSALNIPAGKISLIYAVDWFLDRFRTMINVWGDSTVTAIVAHLSRKEIAEYEKGPKLDEIKIPGHKHLSELTDDDEIIVEPHEIQPVNHTHGHHEPQPSAPMDTHHKYNVKF